MEIAAKAAIDRYFAERNTHFAGNPKRAGCKIWGKERVPSEFHEGQNCKAGVSLGAGVDSLSLPMAAGRAFEPKFSLRLGGAVVCGQGL